MARNLATHGRGKSKKERSSSKAGRWFRRSKSKSSSQQTEAATTTSNNNATPISPTPLPANETQLARSNSEEPPQNPASGTVIRENSVTTSEGGDQSSLTNLDINLTQRPSFERELTPASIMSSEFESGTEDERSLRQMASPTHSASRPSVTSDEVIVTATRAVPTITTEAEEPSTASRQGEVPSSGGSELRERQSSIVHGSLLTNADRTAAARARNKRRQRLDTDEYTNSTGRECQWSYSQLGVWSCCGCDFVEGVLTK